MSVWAGAASLHPPAVIQLLFLNVDDLDYISIQPKCVQPSTMLIQYAPRFLGKTTVETVYLQHIDCDWAFWSIRSLKEHSKINVSLF